MTPHRDRREAGAYAAPASTPTSAELDAMTKAELRHYAVAVLGLTPDDADTKAELREQIDQARGGV